VHGERVELMMKYIHVLFEDAYSKFTKNPDTGKHDHMKFYNTIRDQMTTLKSKSTDSKMGQ
jgi:hypothetical protein